MQAVSPFLKHGTATSWVSRYNFLKIKSFVSFIQKSKMYKTARPYFSELITKVEFMAKLSAITNKISIVYYRQRLGRKNYAAALHNSLSLLSQNMELLFLEKLRQ